MNFELLGPFRVVAEGASVALGGFKERALLAVLVLNRNRPVSPDRLIDALWSDRPPSSAQNSVQVYVSRLRRKLPVADFHSQVLFREAGGYVLRIPDEAVDAVRFEQLLAEGGEALRGGDPVHAEAILARALGLWRGAPLSEFTFEPFARAEVIRLEELHLRARVAWLEALLALGRHAESVGDLQALVEQHPLEERLRALLMVALHRSGRPTDALDAFRELRAFMADELGLEPSPELRALELAILRQDEVVGDSALAAPRAPRRTPRHELRFVTVLAVAFDIAGVDHLGPEDLDEVGALGRRRLCAEVEMHGGRVLSSLGDVMVAVFGVPVAHDDDPERALRSALEIREWVRATGVRSVRVAVETGEVLTHTSDTAPAEPLLTGDVINAVVRMHALAPVDAVVVGPRAYESTRDLFKFEARPLETRGTRTWRTVVARREERAERAPAELVGRQRELMVLTASLEHIQAVETPTLVAVLGEAGIGKTRLLQEFERHVRSRGLAHWCEGHSLPYGRSAGFSAISQIVKAEAGILDSDARAEAGDKLLRAVKKNAGDTEAEWLTSHLRPLVGLGEGTDATVSSRPEAFAAWRVFLEGLARRLPHVFVLEDLHWADSGVVDFVNSFVECVVSAPVLIVVTGRPELLEDPQWAGGIASATRIELAPLSEHEQGLLLDQLLDVQLTQALRSEVLAKSNGNPLYTEQYARLVGERPLLAAVEVPDTVRTIIAARIDALPVAEKSFLQSAAVFPSVFWTGAAAAVEGIEHRSADVHVQALVRKQLLGRLSASSVGGEAELAFRHVLVREVAYGQLTRAERAKKHQHAASWISTLGGSHDHAEALAYHYESALALHRNADGRDELRQLARDALVAAAQRGFALHAFDPAAAFYGRAVRLTSKQDPDRPQLLLQLARALYFSGEPAAERALQDAQLALLAADERYGAAEASALMADLAWHRGRRDVLDEQLETAQELLDQNAPAETRARVLETVARFRAKTGNHAAAIRSAREALLAVDEVDAPELRANILITLGVSRWQARDRRGVTDIEHGLELAVRTNALTAAPRGYSNLAHVLAQDGDPTRPQELLLASQGVAERLGERQLVRRTRANLIGFDKYGRGDWDEAMRLATEFITECETGSPHVAEHQVRTVRAAIWLGRGDADAAVAEDERALELARAAGTQSTRWQLAANAFSYAQLNQLERARVYAEEVISLGHGERAFWAGAVFMLGTVAEPLGVNDRLQALLGPPDQDWFEERALRAVLAGDFVSAATMMCHFGRRTTEALLRLRAGQSLLAREDRAEATEQLENAMSFYRSVAAHHYVAQIESLLAGVRSRRFELGASTGAA